MTSDCVGSSDDCPGIDRDVICRVRREQLDVRMFCHPQTHRCDFGCTRDSDCPTGWLCDGGADAGDMRLCINPACDGL